MPHNFDFGHLNFTDRLLNSTQVVRPGKMMSVLSFEQTFLVKGTIHFIQALDQKREFCGGCVYLSEGGVGFSHVTLRFKSVRGQGVRFLVNIYGRS
uniref:Unkown protein n=1 Tax=Riptortus pedestris TaxID=329032 RepID=R4WE35_RIPPE|nr:unkown protein [Riptortus pedestris]